MPDATHFLGLISGTSVDGIDAAIVRISDDGRPALVYGHTHPYPRDLQRAVRTLIRDGSADLARLGRVDVAVGAAFAQAADSALQASGFDAGQVRAIGSHGQTIWHAPDGNHPFTLQIGDPNVIATRTGMTVVADFRRLDVARGGQGAPLVPPFHAAAFASSSERRVIVNLGGIANLTVLGRDDASAVSGFDSGPASALLDAWCARHQGAPFDVAGDWARGGKVHSALLARLLSEPYLHATPPKSTGKELFNLAYVDAAIAALDAAPAAQDVQASLLEFTAVSVGDALKTHAPGTDRVLVCGGGVHNDFLLTRLRHHLDSIPLESTAAHGIDPDHVEAGAFAWLACRRLCGQVTTLASVTGASRDSISGAIYEG